ncbi:Putative metal-dependent hydrolase YfiT [Aquisphaera giovannonii]|uniref:Metal-dependent hydrolase YfiT n=1 Tax=Aquisphaera giovannonii TaxID=406548 RepID=A0A5B9W064_9BACT|nr:DinB family protein [Aquisphaera giovannonii]QEH34012.1 Putative metal-dependent hydrolase YfiT [Aquisphaera giovannonii]
MTPIESLIERYAAGSTLLAYAAGGIHDEKARERPGPGRWSCAELVAHIVDSDLVDSDRMKRVIADEAATLLPYDENRWVAGLHSAEMPIDAGLALFAANRAWTARILRACDEAAFRRAGLHGERGRLTLAELVAANVTHLDHHLRFLYGKRANLGISVQPRYLNSTID